jgi:hypothetical protein
MRGGEIVIAGDAGCEVAMNLRRGWIVVAGEIGAGCGFNMLAGTVVCRRVSELQLGMGMRRGTIICKQIVSSQGKASVGFHLGARQAAFGAAYPAHEVAVRLMFRFIESCNKELTDDQQGNLQPLVAIDAAGWLRRQGDLSVHGFGEILLPE